MSKRLMILLIFCFASLTGCIDYNNTSKEELNIYSSYNINDSEFNDEVSTLDSWWIFLKDPVLSRLISSAINSNQNNVKFYKDYVALDIFRKYSNYIYLKAKVKIIDEYINKRKDLFQETGKERAYQLGLLKERIDVENSAINVSREIVKATNLLPEYVSYILKDQSELPSPDIKPILASNSSIIFSSPKFKEVAFSFLRENKQKISIQDIKSIFPDMMFSSFFGVGDDVYLDDFSKWSISVGSAIRNLQLDILEEEHEKYQSYDRFIDSVYNILIEIEHKIIAYANMLDQYIVLRKAQDDYKNKCLKTLEDSICDQAYKSSLDLLRAKYELLVILADLYEIMLVDAD